MTMKLRLLAVMLLLATIGFLYRTSDNTAYIIHYLNSLISESLTTENLSPNAVLRQGNGILLMETTDRMEPPSLVLCAIESAARVYPDRPVVFFMKGLGELSTEEGENRTRKHFPTLSSFDNIYLFPLRMEEIFTDTPLLPWYKKVLFLICPEFRRHYKSATRNSLVFPHWLPYTIIDYIMMVNPEQEPYWIHVSSDGCRLALIWKHGGIYMDTDIISIRAIPDQNFLAAQSSHYSSNGVFGFSSHHYFTWKCMEDFVQNYRGGVWGYQGPQLFTRVLQKFCTLPEFKGVDDIMCGNISFLNPQHFYPIPYPEWRRYFEVWDKLPTFNDSYALHLWNYMNNEHRTMKPGSNTLVENLYKTHCPSTYLALKNNESTYL